MAANTRSFVTLITVLCLAACSDEPPPKAGATGEELYGYYCAACHRAEGTGAFLNGVPSVRYNTLSARELSDLIHGHNRPANSKMPVFEISQSDGLKIGRYVHDQLGKEAEYRAEAENHAEAESRTKDSKPGPTASAGTTPKTRNAAVEACEHQRLVQAQEGNESINKSACLDTVHKECLNRFGDS